MSDTDQCKEDDVLKRMLSTRPSPHRGPDDYVVIDGALYAAKIKARDDRSMVADLYRNDADYRVGKAMERSVSLDLA